MEKCAECDNEALPGYCKGCTKQYCREHNQNHSCHRKMRERRLKDDQLMIDNLILRKNELRSDINVLKKITAKLDGELLRVEEDIQDLELCRDK
jgi:hypothetical protein